MPPEEDLETNHWQMALPKMSQRPLAPLAAQQVRGLHPSWVGECDGVEESTPTALHCGNKDNTGEKHSVRWSPQAHLEAPRDTDQLSFISGSSGPAWCGVCGSYPKSVY